MRDYRLIKERTLVPLIIWNMVIVVPLLFIYFRDKYYLEAEERFLILGIALSLGFLIYSICLRLRRRTFLMKGTAYDGKILECDSKVGKMTAYYLYIQIKYQGNKKVIKTESFRQDPNTVLMSDRCKVFEKKGKFYPALFEYSTNRQVQKVKIKKITNLSITQNCLK